MHELGHVRIVLGRDTDQELGTERTGDLGVEEGAEIATVDATDHLADQVPVGEGVVAVRGARLPEGLLGGERVGDRAVVEHRARRHRVAQRGQAGLVAHELTNGDIALAAGPHGQGGPAETGECRDDAIGRANRCRVEKLSQARAGP